MMIIQVPQLLKQPLLWRFVGFASSAVGLLCYALSSSFTRLYGDWDLLKIVIYIVVSLIICSFMLFPKTWKRSRSLMIKAHAGFSVLMLTSLYSFFYDKAVNGSKPDVLNLVSCAAFVFMSFSLSRQIELEFLLDLLNFFLGCFILQLMKINFMLASVGAAFSYSLIVLRLSLDSQIENNIGFGSSVTITHDHVPPVSDIDSASQTNYICHRFFSFLSQIWSIKFRSKPFELRFINKLPDTIFMQSNIMAEDEETALQIALFDAASQSVVNNGALSSIKVEISALDGEFSCNGCEDWTQEEFNRYMVRTREGREPLLSGEKFITLKNGVGCITNIKFTDKSSWLNRKFRLGARVVQQTLRSKIKEGKSEPFVVKDSRGKMYKKHHPPSLMMIYGGPSAR